MEEERVGEGCSAEYALRGAWMGAACPVRLRRAGARDKRKPCIRTLAAGRGRRVTGAARTNEIVPFRI